MSPSSTPIGKPANIQKHTTGPENIACHSMAAQTTEFLIPETSSCVSSSLENETDNEGNIENDIQEEVFRAPESKHCSAGEATEKEEYVVSDLESSTSLKRIYDCSAPLQIISSVVCPLTNVSKTVNSAQRRKRKLPSKVMADIDSSSEGWY